MLVETMTIKITLCEHLNLDLSSLAEGDECPVCGTIVHIEHPIFTCACGRYWWDGILKAWATCSDELEGTCYTVPLGSSCEDCGAWLKEYGMYEPRK